MRERKRQGEREREREREREGTNSCFKISRNQVNRIGYLAYGRVLQYFLKVHLLNSTNFFLMIDGTSDFGHTRNPLAILLTGRSKADGDLWVLPMRFCEPKDHKAPTQVEEVLKMFDTINMLLDGTFEGKKRMFVY